MDSRGVALHSMPMAQGANDTISLAELERRALQLESEQRLVEARAAFEAALRLNPASQFSVEGRARMAIHLREEGALEHCRRALAYHESDPELQLQMIATAAGELGHAVVPLLESHLGRYPEDVAAHELLADLRAQAGEGEGSTDSYLVALSQHPESLPLLKSYWSILSRSGRHADALRSMDANRAKIEGNRDFAMLEVAIAGHAGQIDRSGRLLETLDNRPDAQMARGLHRLQSNQPHDAVKYLSTVIVGQPDNLEAWALLELAWRITSDHRHEWLLGQPRLWGPLQLELSAPQLKEIAVFLRGLHHAKAHPIGQSLRGGTQTSGQLFLRNEPEITLLIESLAASIRQFVGNLPPADPLHPLLKYRDSAMAFGPSWSVRFTGSGHHAAHFHPGGVLSSACYISVPETIADVEDKPGWLEIGRPPAELGLNLPPLATIEPKPGRLVLFPSFLFHGTRPFAGGERLTVAFDLVPVSTN